MDGLKRVVKRALQWERARFFVRVVGMVTCRTAGRFSGWEDWACRFSGRLAAVVGEQTIQCRRLGVPMTLDLADNLQRILYFTGTYEPGFQRFLRAELQPGDTYLDVGGHIGVDAVVAADRVGPRGRVLVFEPAPDSAARLRSSTSKFLNVSIVEAALGEEPGTLELRQDPRYSPRDAGVRSLLNEGDVVCTVAVVPFDGWRDGHHLNRLDVVKLDVEGFELSALRGMTQTLASLRPRAVVVEVNAYRLGQAGATEDDVDAHMASIGYLPVGWTFIENKVYRPTS